jgi:hypothetical protein
MKMDLFIFCRPNKRVSDTMPEEYIWNKVLSDDGRFYMRVLPFRQVAEVLLPDSRFM